MVDFDAMVNTSTGDVLLARSYWGRALLAGEAPADGVNALGVALGEAMTVFAGELATTLPAGQD
jgi:dipeptidase